MASPAIGDGMPSVTAGDDVDAPGPLALVEAFVNTYDVETDSEVLADPSVLGRWLTRRGLLTGGARITDEGDLRRAIAVREALRDLLRANHDGGPPPGDALAVLEREASAAPLAVAFPEGHATLRPTGEGLDEALARLLGIVWHAMHDGTWERLKICNNDTCAVAFWDASRNRSGRWCSMAVCGNRAKVANFRERHG